MILLRVKLNHLSKKQSICKFSLCDDVVTQLRKVHLLLIFIIDVQNLKILSYLFHFNSLVEFELGDFWIFKPIFKQNVYKLYNELFFMISLPILLNYI